MEQAELYDAIFKRKSVRKFDPAPLDADTLAKVSTFLGTVRPMFPEIKVELRVLSGPDVKIGLMGVKAPHYVAAFSQDKHNSLINVGFMLQQVDLFLSASGIGSLWLGNPTPAGPAKHSKLGFVIMLAFGRPAEPVHRAGASEFKRDPFTKISDVEGCEELLEPARLAPSAMNKQPWLFTGNASAIHVHCDRSPMFEKWNKIGVGAALCHAWLAAEHVGKSAEFEYDEKGKYDAPKDHFYVVTMRPIGRAAVQPANVTEHDVSYSFEVEVGDTVVRSP
jgi:nitroreductase